MKIQTDIPLLDELLQGKREQLGDDFTAYRNHCLRVFNFCVALSAANDTTKEKIAIALAFHDIGIWTHGTIDYLEPSQTLAQEYLARTNRNNWAHEMTAMIAEHHKCRKAQSDPTGLVECFRKADWVDVSLGMLKFGLPGSFVAETRAAFPNAGFHKRLVALTLKRMKTHPFSPLPMMKF
jgi:hypothetical protein